VDASVVTSALVDRGPDGVWSALAMRDHRLVTPHLLPVEVANVLRRAVLAGRLSDDVAAMAHGDLVALPFDLVEYAPFAERCWQLRASVSVYDAWYVAVAEAFGAELATLDRRLLRAPGPRCLFVSPPPRP